METWGTVGTFDPFDKIYEVCSEAFDVSEKLLMHIHRP